MNKIASRQIKSPITSNFSKATAEDLRRLTSTSIEYSYSRVQWTNPKDGKVYNLLKLGETEYGNNTTTRHNRNDSKNTPKIRKVI